MALAGLQLHHAAVRMDPVAVEETLHLYQDVLGLVPDAGARRIPGIPGTWLDADGDGQLHLFGVSGTSQYAASPEQDPFRPHVAFGVPSIEEALAELTRLRVEHWTAGTGERRQAFLSDASGNLVELHQTGTCRCRRSDRPEPPDRSADGSRSGHGVTASTEHS